MIKRVLLTTLVAVLVLGAIFGYKYKTGKAAAQAAANRRPPPVTVTAAEVSQETWQNTLSAVGDIESSQGITVRTEIEGRIVRLEFESGAKVNAGDVLIELDASAEEAQLRALEARAQLAATTLQRQQELREKATNTQADLDAAQATAAEAAANVEGVKTILAKKRIVAPFAGRLGIRLVNTGQFLNKGDAIVSLEALDPVYVDFTLPQQDIGAVKAGLSVRSTVDAFPDRSFDGKIEAVDPRVNSETRNIRVRAVVANPEEVLRPGMFCRTEVLLPEKQSVFVLPSTAIVYSPYGDSVYVVSEQPASGPNGASGMIAQQRFIKMGANRGDQVAIASGLKPGERVVTSGQIKLRNGAAVQVNNAVVPANNPNPKPAES